MDKEDDLSKYHPISHLSFLSKLTDTTSDLTEYLSDSNLLNSIHLAYIKHHYTKTALLSVHDLIIKAIGHQQLVTCLTLLDLSAAFNTIHQTILLDRFFCLVWSLLGQILDQYKVKSNLMDRFFMSI
jgi:hypothetical protein